MNKFILIMSFVMLVSACGKKDSSPAAAVSEVKGSDPLSVPAAVYDLDSFVGNYDLISMDEGDCGASMQVIKLCEGVQARNNHSASQSFCNVNKGEIVTGDKRSSLNVTFEGNVIKSVGLIFDERSTPPGKVKQVMTNTLTIEGGGLVRKFSDSKAISSSCLYQKR